METRQGEDAVLGAAWLSRREVLGGGLLLGALALTGCGGSRAGATGGDLPNPRWNNSVAATPPVCIVPPSKPAPPIAAASGNVVIMPRSAWTSSGPRKGIINDMNGVSRITVHHEGSIPFSSTSQSDVVSRLNQVRNAHLDRRAKTGERWCDIGYHYIIDPNGVVWEGRNTRYQGAHVQDENEHNLGIMVLGNFERQRPTPASLATLDTFVAMQMQRYRVPISRVRTHREIGSTECPGRNLQAYMNQTRSRGGRLTVAAVSVNLA